MGAGHPIRHPSAAALCCAASLLLAPRRRVACGGAQRGAPHGDAGETFTTSCTCSVNPADGAHHCCRRPLPPHRVVRGDMAGGCGMPAVVVAPARHARRRGAGRPWLSPCRAFTTKTGAAATAILCSPQGAHQSIGREHQEVMRSPAARRPDDPTGRPRLMRSVILRTSAVRNTIACEQFPSQKFLSSRRMFFEMYGSKRQPSKFSGDCRYRQAAEDGRSLVSRRRPPAAPPPWQSSRGSGGAA